MGIQISHALRSLPGPSGSLKLAVLFGVNTHTLTLCKHGLPPTPHCLACPHLLNCTLLEATGHLGSDLSHAWAGFPWASGTDQHNDQGGRSLGTLQMFALVMRCVWRGKVGRWWGARSQGRVCTQRSHSAAPGPSGHLALLTRQV